MRIADFSIKQTTLIVSIMLTIVIVGIASFKSMSIDLFPNIDVPIVSVVTIYPGAGPNEIENLVSRPLEEQIASISGMKHLTSKSLEGVSTIIAEFRSGVDIKSAEQEIRDKINLARPNMPTDIEEPLIRRFDPSDQPVMTLALSGKNLSPADLFDLADETVKKRLEQVKNIGAIEIYGGRKREIQVLLNRDRLNQKEMSVTQVSSQIGASGENIPSGKVNDGDKELAFRGFGEIESVGQISKLLVNLYGNEVPIPVSSLGEVKDGLEDEKNRTYVGDAPALLLYVYRQSGTNTIEVVDAVKASMALQNEDFKAKGIDAELQTIVDSSRFIRENIYDVYETIAIAILLTVITVLFFLGDFKTTLITALSLPVSLIGAFIAMKLADFSVNVISLISLSLAVGLLVDDAIVVIENIHRKIESGLPPLKAAAEGTNEIQVSVFAITLVVISVFVPVAFMSGTIGQFLQQFGLTIAFSMVVSLIVSFTLIPMLSAYFLEEHSSHKNASPSFWKRKIEPLLEKVENAYGWLLEKILKHPLTAIFGTLAVFALSIVALTQVPSSFKPANNSGQIVLKLELAPGTSLDGTEKVALQMKETFSEFPAIDFTTLTVGGKNGEANKGEFFIQLKKGKERGGTTAEFQDRLRQRLAKFDFANPILQEYDPSGGISGSPINLNLRSSDSKLLQTVASELLNQLKSDKRVTDLDSDYRPGKPDYQVVLRNADANTYGVLSKSVGLELRGQVEGFTPAKFRVDGREYDIRVRLRPEDRNIQTEFKQILVPNVNHKLVRLSDVADLRETESLAEVNRLDRTRSIKISGGVVPGVGLSEVSKDIETFLKQKQKESNGALEYSWAGDVENMNEMQTSATMAIGFAIIFIYLILSSLYGSFVTPVTILLALPFALSGAFIALFVSGESISIFAILGIFLLLGVAGKNSILLVDFANQRIAEGLDRSRAILEAGLARLRPILMTSFALIAGTVPVAIGLNEASQMRTSMGWAIIGGVLSSTLLTLIAVPAVFSYIDRFRIWSKGHMARRFIPAHRPKKNTPSPQVLPKESPEGASVQTH